jgi:hypothetical protein
MPVEIVRGQVGTENVWNMGQESGFIAYMRGSIGDLPVTSEAVVLAEAMMFDDSFGEAEDMLRAEGKLGDDAPSYSESTTITNE